MELSIIIPVYNGEKYLNECLNSVFAINKEKSINYEVIVINDGSTDSSLKILEKIKSPVPFRIISQQNKGLSVARNIGISNSNGKFVFFLDCDDYIVPNTFLDYFNQVKYSNVQVSYANFVYMTNGKIYKTNNIVMSKRIISKISGRTISGLKFCDSTFNKLNDWARIEVVTSFYNREFLNSKMIRFTEGILHEDVLFTYSILANADEVQYFNKDIYVYRQNDESIMHNEGIRNYISKYKIALELYKIKIQKNISLVSWDSMIIELLSVSIPYIKMYDKTQIKCILDKSKKLTLKSILKKIYIYYLFNNKPIN